ncbi:MAG: RNA polymerase sigma factor [Oscillospiraceae bacterium]|nr:RNA polymerase sigma factor [Oscillospiraceae bacterium]MDE6657783.1 RNA polymerase sigma factor [Oscillospiraceae bacterium]
MQAFELVNQYGDMLYRICLLSLKNHADAEDAVQEVFLKYFTRAPEFNSENHRKAWLITVALNQCKTMHRQKKRSIPTEPELLKISETVSQENHAILDALVQVPEKFRTVLILYYVEGYKIKEIAGLIGKSSSAVKMRLSKGRKLLETIYRKEYLS